MPSQITSFDPHARPPNSFRKSRPSDLILFSQILSMRNEGRHEALVHKPRFPRVIHQRRENTMHPDSSGHNSSFLLLDEKPMAPADVWHMLELVNSGTQQWCISPWRAMVPIPGSGGSKHVGRRQSAVGHASGRECPPKVNRRLPRVTSLRTSLPNLRNSVPSPRATKTARNFLAAVHVTTVARVASRVMSGPQAHLMSSSGLYDIRCDSLFNVRHDRRGRPSAGLFVQA